MSAKQWKAYKAVQDKSGPFVEFAGDEQIDMNESYAQMAKAQRQRPLRKMPYVVISHGMRQESIEKATEPAWQQAQIKLAKLVAGGRRIVASRSR